MKHIFEYLSIAFVVAITISCAKEIQNVGHDGCVTTVQVPEGKVFKTFRVTNEATKGDIIGSTLKWEVGDSIAIFDNINPKDTNKFKITLIEGNAIEIEGTVSETATKFKAVYPYKAFVNNEVGDSIKVTISGYQYIPAGKQVDPRYLVAVASSSGMDFTFRNVFSLARFKISKEEISAVKFFGAKGNAIVRAGTAELVKAADYNPIIVKPAEGEYFAPGEYYAVVLPCTMEGLDVVCTEGESKLTWKQNTTETLNFKRNSGCDFGKIDNGNQLVAKWIFRKPYNTDVSTNFAGNKKQGPGYSTNAEGKEAYVSSDFAGKGKIRYYGAASMPYTRKTETSATSLYSLTAGGYNSSGSSYGAYQGDYWDFSVKKEIPEGSKVHIWFKTNTSSGPKHWQVQYSQDGTNWTIGETLNVPTTGDFNCTVDKTWEITKTIPGDDYVSLFRFMKVTEDKGWPRILDNPEPGGFDWSPFIEIIED